MQPVDVGREDLDVGLSRSDQRHGLPVAERRDDPPDGLENEVRAERSVVEKRGVGPGVRAGPHGRGAKAGRREWSGGKRDRPADVGFIAPPQQRSAGDGIRTPGSPFPSGRIPSRRRLPVRPVPWDNRYAILTIT